MYQVRNCKLRMEEDLCKARRTPTAKMTRTIAAAKNPMIGTENPNRRRDFPFKKLPEIDNEAKIIHVNLPKVHISKVNVDITSLDYIFINDKIFPRIHHRPCNFCGRLCQMPRVCLKNDNTPKRRSRYRPWKRLFMSVNCQPLLPYITAQLRWLTKRSRIKQNTMFHTMQRSTFTFEMWTFGRLTWIILASLSISKAIFSKSIPALTFASYETQYSILSDQEDAQSESEKEEAIFELAKQNAENIVRALIEPFMEQLDSAYTLDIDWEG